MERINKDTIRVMMTLEELNDRGIKMLDLVQDHKQIEDFFYSVLDEVDSTHTFVNNGPVTFQVMPNGGGLEIYISRTNQDDTDDETNEDAFQLDGDDADGNDQNQPQGDRFTRIARDKLSQFFGDETGTANDKQPAAKQSFFGDHDHVRSVVIALDSFEDLISLAQELYLNGGKSDLYKYQDAYFLVLTFDKDFVEDFDAERQANIAAEYGHLSPVGADVLSEYGQHLITDSALETARYYFK
ncbi:adaptor protein MecA [Lacticaseibacillus songhuajiangensis]|jgi:adapter protein MecA 1/2|uniref:adaptor protein MecA n=1 Tax=Lacticaseibacillus songhuajiangensis TaxID=1296539 RepID=UPI001CDCB509|nr:adaptor protein MecA [Lacticaseibacillus songhuajiangensis]MCI1283525.1 adaptor protein MecA [Lacticaseibacillus songhuajiangensis]